MRYCMQAKACTQRISQDDHAPPPPALGARSPADLYAFSVSLYLHILNHTYAHVHINRYIFPSISIRPYQYVHINRYIFPRSNPMKTDRHLWAYLHAHAHTSGTGCAAPAPLVWLTSVVLLGSVAYSMCPHGTWPSFQVPRPKHPIEINAPSTACAGSAAPLAFFLSIYCLSSTAHPLFPGSTWPFLAWPQPTCLVEANTPGT